MLTIAVLGPVEVRRDGRPLRVPSGKPAELLVRLALEVGTPVRADRLIEDLWGTEAVDVDRNTLQSKVSQLRRALGDPALLTHGAGGYTLLVDPASVDTERAIRLAGDGRAIPSVGRRHRGLYRRRRGARVVPRRTAHR